MSIGLASDVPEPQWPTNEKLPCTMRIGVNRFHKGVSASIFQHALDRRLEKSINVSHLTPEQVRRVKNFVNALNPNKGE